MAYVPPVGKVAVTRRAFLPWGVFMAIWVLAEANGWDKTAAVAGVVAALIGIGSVVWALWRWWWPQWRERHTFRFDRPPQIAAGKAHTLTIMITFLRNARLNQPMIRLSPYDYDAGRTTLDALIASWHTESGLEGFPREVNRGQEIVVRVHVDARLPVKGFLRIEAADDHGRLRVFAQPLTIFAADDGGSGV